MIFIGGGLIILVALFVVFYLTTRRKKPLLILDMNNVLVFRCNQHFQTKDYPHLVKYNHLASLLGGRFLTWQRPYLTEFLDFCFANYTVAVWSSARAENVDDLVDFVFGKSRTSLLFVWNQSQCKVMDPPGGWKPQFRKQLSHVWAAFPDYNETNTVMIDDSIDKMSENPTWTQRPITPWYPNLVEDCELKNLSEGL